MFMVKAEKLMLNSKFSNYLIYLKYYRYFCNYLLTKPKNSKLMEFDLPLSFKKEEVEIRQK